MSNIVSQSQFARLIGVARSYVTALKKAGRLVMDETGNNVLVAESKRRIAETADPNRDDVRTRWADQREETAAVDAEETAKTEDESPSGHDYQKARAQKEHYFAEQARIDFERAIGKLVERSEVEAAIEDVTSVIRQALEQMPHRTAPELVGKSLDQIRASLKQDIHAALSEMEREFTKRLNLIGSEE